MGLHQYLYGVKTEFDTHDNNIQSKITLIGIGYWEKANQIHKWFVDNIQEGADNRATYYVSFEQLEDLKETCEKVLENQDLAAQVLPTYEGCFYGSQEYDSGYYADLQDTIEIINEALSKPYEYYGYSSSW